MTPVERYRGNPADIFLQDSYTVDFGSLLQVGADPSTQVYTGNIAAGNNVITGNVLSYNTYFRTSMLRPINPLYRPDAMGLAGSGSGGGLFKDDGSNTFRILAGVNSFSTGTNYNSSSGYSYLDNQWIDSRIAVPEPGTLSMALVGGFMILRRRRRN